MLKPAETKMARTSGGSFAIIAPCFDFARDRKPVIIFP
jgi:hypothetical protein